VKGVIEGSVACGILLDCGSLLFACMKAVSGMIWRGGGKEEEGGIRMV